jgi:pimeloyl-ACP methyl ester carboxylesterase
MAIELRKHETEILGLRTPIMEAGDATADEAVVFIHGHPGSSRDWERLVGEVGQFGRAVAFDLPGFGKADKPKDWNYTIGAFASFTAAVINKLGIKRAHLVVHDLGGGAGLLWAAAHPDSFASAVIMGTGVLIGFKWHPAAQVYRAPFAGDLLAALTNRVGFQLVMRKTNPKLPPEFINQLWEDYSYRTRRAALEMYRASPSTGFERLAPLFRELDRPALVLWGRNDPFVGPEQAERQKESFPRAEVVLLDTGHWPFIEEPDAAAEHIGTFLRRQLSVADAQRSERAT